MISEGETREGLRVFELPVAPPHPCSDVLMTEREIGSIEFAPFDQ